MGLQGFEHCWVTNTPEPLEESNPSDYFRLHLAITLTLRGHSKIIWASRVVLVVKNLIFPSGSSGDVRDMGSIPGSGWSPGGGYLQYSCLKNPMDRGAWWPTVHRVSKSWTQFSTYLKYHQAILESSTFHIWPYFFDLHYMFIYNNIFIY